MDNDTSERPDCFGELEKVFPMSKRGLRETPDDCMYQCHCKTACLRAAMDGVMGVKVQEELIERGEEAGMLTFFQRWSKKKQLARKRS